MAVLNAEQRSAFEADMRAAACTREAIDAVFLRHYGPSPAKPYPDEWYADKNNRWDGKPTGHLRHEGGKMVWIKHV